MKFIIILLLSISNQLLAQTIFIPSNKARPVAPNEFMQLVDTSKKYISDDYESNLTPWDIFFKEIKWNHQLSLLKMSGGASIGMNENDTFRITNINIVVARLINDTLANIAELAGFEREKATGDFNLEIDLSKYNVMLFYSSLHFPKMFYLKDIIKGK